ncbi:MAG: serine/threonine protein kinase [Acidobacteria bacterium]|nr:serine/threonine protein kinase [Acidobacteriota bacterium]
MQASSATPLSTAWTAKRARFAPRRLPSELGDYLLVEHVGRGGMADIYLAERRFAIGARRTCAVKEIIPELCTNERFLCMLGAEARLVSRLRHPNIVGVECLDAASGAPFIVMEYVEGLDLRELLRRATERRMALPLAVSITILCDVLRGLDHAHRATDAEGRPLGVVHRDVSPSNVLLGFDGQVKLCDFGIAASVDGVPTEAIEGKAGYMSPEHARGEPVDARADLFAVGIMLWELVSGRRLYQKASGVPLLVQARRAARPALPLRDLPEEEWLHAVIDRALAVNRAERYGSAREMLHDLEDYALDTRMLISTTRLGAWLRASFEADARFRRSEKVRRAAEGDVPSEPPPSQPSFPETPQSGEVACGSRRRGERGERGETATPGDAAPSPTGSVAVGATDECETPGAARVSGERVRAGAGAGAGTGPGAAFGPCEVAPHEAPTHTAGQPSSAPRLERDGVPTEGPSEPTRTSATRRVDLTADDLVGDAPRRERRPARTPKNERRAAAPARKRVQRTSAMRGSTAGTTAEVLAPATRAAADPSLWAVGVKYALTAGVVTFVFLWWVSQL